jgi:hypothetical protein
MTTVMGSKIKTKTDTPDAMFDVVVAIAVPDPPDDIDIDADAVADPVEADLETTAAPDEDVDGGDTAAASNDATQQQHGDIEQGVVIVDMMTVTLVKMNRDDKLGFTYVKAQDGTTTIKTVIPGGLASRAGLEVGMRLWIVNGVNAYDVVLGELDAGTTSFTVERGCENDDTPVAVAVPVVPQEHPHTAKSPRVRSNDTNEVTSRHMICPLQMIVLGIIVMFSLSIIVGAVIVAVGIIIWACIRRKMERSEQ